MPLDKAYYYRCIDSFEKIFESVFANDMIDISVKQNINIRGSFKLIYRYVPCNYKIVVENEFRTFDIIIYDEEGASNVLNHIEHYDATLNEKNITEAVMLLKKVLEKNNLDFYFSRDDKLYKKNKNGIKRIKDIKELINE